MPIRTRKLKNGKIVFDVRAEYGGIRLSRTVPTTITEAKRVESKILQDLIQGKYETFRKTEDPTFSEYANRYIKSVKWQKSHYRTVQIVENLVKFFRKNRLTQITTQDFIDYRTMRLETVKNATVNREHACLRRMLNLASMSTNYTIRENPLKGLKMLEEAPAEDRTLTVDEYYRLLDAAPEYFRRIIFFACNTAMRKMEILNLQFKQIKIWMKGGEIELIETKSGEREKVTLSLEVIELLKQIAKERKIHLDSMIGEQKNEYVFTGMRGQRLFSVKKPMIRTLNNAGIEPRPFHTFRHFWTTEMFRAGVDVAKIKNLGRWKDFKTMLRYCHSYRLDEQEAVDQLSSHLSRRPGKILKIEATQ